MKNWITAEDIAWNAKVMKIARNYVVYSGSYVPQKFMLGSEDSKNKTKKEKRRYIDKRYIFFCLKYLDEYIEFKI